MSAVDVELRAERDGVALAGSLWLPAGPAQAAVLMVPGSGPSDRHNDVLFPPIRQHLLESSVAVAAFDKRGVGESSGDWRDADIVDQAADALACLEELRDIASLADTPIGLFGHSQGGWVVLEAAARDARLAFVVTNSGPGVTPADQERFAVVAGARRAGLSAPAIDAVLADFDAMLALIRAGTPYREFRELLEADAADRARYAALADLTFVPEDAGQWDFVRRSLDYDPRPALERISCPILALFGADDRVVPVDQSVGVFRAARRVAGGLTVHVFSGANHRCQVDDPPRMADGYLDLLSGCIAQQAISEGPSAGRRLDGVG